VEASVPPARVMPSAAIDRLSSPQPASFGCL
jgi:hypothetical protein